LVLGWQRSTLCAEAHLRLCGQHVGRSLELGAGRDDRRQARVERYGGGRERGWLTELLRHARADHESAAQLSLRVCPQLELHRLRAAQPGFGCVRVCVTSQPSPQLSSSRFRRLLLLLSLRPILAASCTPRVFQRRPPARLPDRQKPLPEGNHGVRSTRPGDADQHSYTRARRVGIIREQCKTPTAGPRQRMSRLHGPASTSSTAPVRAMPAHERLRAAVVCGRARAVPWLEAGVVEPPDL
jgi:hypothetical protein